MLLQEAAVLLGLSECTACNIPSRSTKSGSVAFMASGESDTFPASGLEAAGACDLKQMFLPEFHLSFSAQVSCWSLGQTTIHHQETTIQNTSGGFFFF